MLATFFIVAPFCNGTWLVAGRAIGSLLSSNVWGRVSVLFMAGLIVVNAGLIALG